MDLTSTMFDQCPVWAHDEFDEAFEPVPEHDPLPEDRGNLYLKTEFSTAAGAKVAGCIRSDHIFAAVFVGGEVYAFNALLPLRDEERATLDRLFPGTGSAIFPLRYATPYAFDGEPPIAGSFTPGEKAWPSLG